MKTIEERIAQVDEILSRGGLVLTDPLMRGTLKNKVFEGGACTGYTFRLNNLSYRGVWLSTIEGLELKVDGEKVDHRDMTLVLGNFYCTIDELKNNSDVFWGCTDQCYINVNKVGGLKAGDHEIEITITKRNDFGHSYGEAEDLEGYQRDATELQHPTVVRDRAVFTI
ncbi:MAG: DUF6379 domain-containing protein [Lachnospiraceae bacterium]|nr:DUF6379 domain-containing protein [Lachnospiraceae bacterium]